MEIVDKINTQEIKKAVSPKKLIKYNTIPFFKLIKFSIKSITKEVLFYVLNALVLISSIAIGVLLAYSKSGESQVIMFNFYILFFVCCLMFVFILRMIQFFFNKNFEDKTTYIVLTNQVSRIKFFLAQYVLIILIIVINVGISFLTINLFYSAFNLLKYDLFILRMTVIYSLYAILAGFLLTNFVIFLIFSFSLQTTTIICTLLLAISFIANIPMSFAKANEKSYNIQLQNKQLFKLNDIYDAYNLNKSIATGNIKYKYLSKYVYDNFLKAQMTQENFNSPENILIRTEMWSKLGLISKESVVINEYNLKLLSKPLRDPTVPATWKTGDEFNLQMTLNKTFINSKKLDGLISQSTIENTKNILKDFKDFTAEITNHFNDNVQFEKYDLMYDFLFMESGIDKSFLEKNNAANHEKKYALKDQDIKTFYEYALIGRNNDGFKFSNADSLVKNDLNFKLMYTARIIEQYFIKYASNYHIISTNSIDTSTADWKAYEKGRSAMQILSYFNLYNGLWMLFTENLGFYKNDIWFSPNSDSKIYLENQKNMFLGYPEYKLTLNNQNQISKDTTSSYIKSWYYLAILMVVSFIGFMVALIRFKKYDFK
ncbi:ABC transporter permease [Mesoplasma seiffertii]|uniref:ABC transporter permease n=1 Tax=Mesoplasma seiffertii TaxID=28224 RepID=UPI001FDFEC52|nr:ABC transporter permease [Mesoplasma seiffertii]